MTWDGTVAANPNLAKLVTYEFQQKELGTLFWALSVTAIAAYPFRRGKDGLGSTCGPRQSSSVLSERFSRPYKRNWDFLQ